jgi:hypothetical protein
VHELVEPKPFVLTSVPVLSLSFKVQHQIAAKILQVAAVVWSKYQPK